MFRIVMRSLSLKLLLGRKRQMLWVVYSRVPFSCRTTRFFCVSLNKGCYAVLASWEECVYVLVTVGPDELYGGFLVKACEKGDGVCEVEEANFPDHFVGRIDKIIE